MKLNIIKYCMSLFIVLATVAAPPLAHAAASGNDVSAEKVKKEAMELMQALKGYSANQRDEAIKKTKAALDKLDRRIDSLEDRVDKSWDKMSKSARDKARANLKMLRKQRTEVAEWYGSLKSSSADAWDHIKKGFSDAYMSLHEAWNKAEREFSDK